MSENIDIAYDSSLQLGSGYDLLAHSARSSPFDKVDRTSSGSHDTDVELSYVETATQMKQLVSVDFDTSFNLFFVGGSASADLLQDVTVDDYSLVFMVRVGVDAGKQILSRPALGKRAAAFVAAKDYAAFRAAFGDYYLSEVTLGGEMYGMIRFVTRSIGERDDLKTKLGVSSIVGSAKAEVESMISKAAESYETQIKVWTRGVAGPTPSPTTVSALFTLAESFPKLVGAGNVIRGELQPMSALPEYQASVAALSAQARNALDDLEQLMFDYTKLRNDIEFMLSSNGNDYFDWDHASRDDVAAARDAVTQRIQAIQTLAAEVLRGTIHPDDPKIVGFVPSYRFDDDLKLPMPIMHVDPSATSIFPLSLHTRGDTYMAGHTPLTTINAVLSISADRKTLSIATHVKMEEGQPDWTTFEDSRVEPILQLQGTGLRIVSAYPLNGRLQWLAAANQYDLVTTEGTGLIKSAKCISATGSDDAGKIGARTIEWTQVRVVVSE